MRRPDLFVVGAMKCGTTSMHADLSTHPMIRVAEKEAGRLAAVNSEASRQEYLDQWKGSTSGEVLADVSATYSMLPHEPEVATRAARLNPAAKVVYLCREPVARIVSHHHHDLAGGVVGPEIDRVVREDPRFVDFTRYSSQLEGWLDAFGAESVRVLRFEDYVADRRSTVTWLTDWLGIEPHPAGTLEPGARNATASTPRATGRVKKLIGSRLYRDFVRPVVPSGLRSRVAGQVLAPPPERPAAPSEETVAWLHEQLTADVERLAGHTHGRVTWPEWWSGS